MLTIKSKLPDVGTSIFSVMGALANKHGAINLSQGFPDFDGDKRLIELVSKYMREGHNQYAPMPGLVQLRERLAEKVNGMYTSSVDPDEITITAGATQAIFTAISTIISHGDEAIVIDPSYDCYGPAVRCLGGVVVPISLRGPEFSLDIERMREAVTEKTRLIILNSPHNPAGKVLYTAHFLEGLKELLRDTNIVLLSDEVYEHLVYDGKQHLSILSDAELFARSMVCFSFGKTFHFTGWKMGYVIAPPSLTKEFRRIHQFNVFSVNRPVQHALAEYLEDKKVYEGLNLFFQEKRDFFQEAVKESRFNWVGCEGSYFCLLDYSELSEKGDMEYARELTIEHKIASIPLTPFYQRPVNQKYLRFCFAKKNETLAAAANILLKV